MMQLSLAAGILLMLLLMLLPAQEPPEERRPHWLCVYIHCSLTRRRGERRLTRPLLAGVWSESRAAALSCDE